MLLANRLLNPYSGDNLPVSHRVFNYRLSRARRIVENAFGILSSRWRIFRRPIACEPKNVINIVKAACVLHNYLRRSSYDPDYLPPGFVDSDGDMNDANWRTLPLPPPIFQDLHQSNEDVVSMAKRSKIGNKLREDLREYFMNEGAVPWQMAKVTVD